MKFQDLRFLWLPILFFFIQTLYTLFTGLPSTRVLMNVVTNTLMVGITEELMFRSILFHGTSSSFWIWHAVWITYIIVDAGHVLNGFISGDFNAIIFQALCAFMFGFYMVALRVRLDTIIPGIIIHWLWDCFALRSHFPEDTMIWVLIYLALFYYGLWLLRNYLPSR